MKSAWYVLLYTYNDTYYLITILVMCFNIFLIQAIPADNTAHNTPGSTIGNPVATSIVGNNVTLIYGTQKKAQGQMAAVYIDILMSFFIGSSAYLVSFIITIGSILPCAHFINRTTL